MYSLEEKMEEVQKIIDNTRVWVASFGPGSKAPRPQHEVDIKARRIDVLKAIREDYEGAIGRKRGAA